MLRALIWDVDGTIAETERDGHRVAFNAALAEAGVTWQWDVETYGERLGITGGYERLLHEFALRADGPAAGGDRERLARAVHTRKNTLYAALVARAEIRLRPGVRRLIDACRRDGVVTAIATTTGRGNVAALLGTHFGADWQDRFAAVVCAEDAPVKKPDPRVYRIALQRLGLEPNEAIAIEDSPNGLSAAVGAGIATVVTRSVYFRNAAFDGATATCDDLESRVVWAGGEAPYVDLDVLRALIAG